MTTKKPIGRPTKFTQAIADEVCERIMNGESLRAIVESEYMPTRSTIHKWLAEDKAFSDQYARAKDNQADTLADDLMFIADNARPEEVQVARLRVDTRKWIASKLKPKKYGDKMEVDNTHRVVTPILGGLAKEDAEDK